MSPVICTSAVLAGAVWLLMAAPGHAQDAAAGQKVFQTCRACHSDVQGRNGFGPTLYGVVGRRAGTAPGYSYSQAMTASGIVWDDATLDAFIAAPRGVVPGTKMPYGGMKDPAKRAQLIAYLKTLRP